jgi:3-deoxy-7-phosphoheptulonate synthase
MLWVGERTRQLDGAHVEFLRGIANPLGIKVSVKTNFSLTKQNTVTTCSQHWKNGLQVSDKMNPSDLVKLIDILNPTNKPGRITVITRMGAENMRVKLPHLIRAVRQAGQIVTWITDPMHGNTIKAPCGLKTRPFDNILVYSPLLSIVFSYGFHQYDTPWSIWLQIYISSIYMCSFSSHMLR